MQSYRVVHSVVHAAIAALCWFVLQNMAQMEDLVDFGELRQFVHDHKTTIALAVAAGLALLFRTSDALSNAIVEKIPVVSRTLRRTLSGKSYIEGEWPLVVTDMDHERPMYLGFLRIDYKDGQPHVHGDDWTMEGEHQHAFRSVQSLHSNNMLQYWYEQGANLAVPQMKGYTEIFFFPPNALAERHAGKFLDKEHTRDIRFYARRRRNGLFQRALRTKEEKLEAARALWTEIEPRLAALKKRDISADFA